MGEAMDLHIARVNRQTRNGNVDALRVIHQEQAERLELDRYLLSEEQLRSRRWAHDEFLHFDAARSERHGCIRLAAFAILQPGACTTLLTDRDERIPDCRGCTSETLQRLPRIDGVLCHSASLLRTSRV